MLFRKASVVQVAFFVLTMVAVLLGTAVVQEKREVLPTLSGGIQGALALGCFFLLQLAEYLKGKDYDLAASSVYILYLLAALIAWMLPPYRDLGFLLVSIWLLQQSLIKPNR